MSDQRSPLDEALRALEQEDAGLGASTDVAERLRFEVRARGRSRRRRQYLFAAAAAAVLVVALFASRGPTSPAPPALAPVVNQEVATDFFPLTDGDLPVRNGYVVRLEVPGTSLAAFGLEPFDPAANRVTIVADVVVGEDGLARAVRFVHAIRQ